MPDNVISIVNQMGEDDGSQEGLGVCNIRKVLTVEDMYDNVNSQDNSCCASVKSWDMKQDGGQGNDENILYDDDMERDEINDLDEVLLQLHN